MSWKERRSSDELFVNFRLLNWLKCFLCWLCSLNAPPPPGPGPINDTSLPRWFTRDGGRCQPCGWREDSPVTTGWVWQAPHLSLWEAAKDVPPTPFFFFLLPQITSGFGSPGWIYYGQTAPDTEDLLQELRYSLSCFFFFVMLAQNWNILFRFYFFSPQNVHILIAVRFMSIFWWVPLLFHCRFEHLSCEC